MTFVGLVIQIRTTVSGKVLQPMHAKHVVYYFIVITFLSLATLQGFFDVRRMQRASDKLAEVKWLIDPVCFASMGLGFYYHAHDTRIVGLIFHRWLGLMLIAVAVSYFAKALVSDSFLFGTNIHRQTSLLTAFCFMLAGAWFVRMGAFLYIYNDVQRHSPVGLHQLLWTDGVLRDEARELEACSLYVGLDMMFSAFAVGLVVICNESVPSVIKRTTARSYTTLHDIECSNSSDGTHAKVDITDADALDISKSTSEETTEKS
jgi:hypothetical protein